jgi:putative ABC transport system permease protein
MSLSQILFEALESLNANKIRSGLTILGIVIGVGAVIAMMGVGQGAKNSITGTISDIGTNLIFIFSGNQQEKIRNLHHLTLHDSDVIGDPFLAPHVQEVAPMVQAE